MAEIVVASAGEATFDVEVREASGSTRHRVTLPEGYLDTLGVAATPAELVEESFRFLLEREPKESILRSFELPVIARYFPEYPQEIRARLG